MWLVTVVLVAGAAGLLWYLYYPLPTRKTITAKEVVADANGYPQGSFQIDPAEDDPDSIHSQGTGGACLVADLKFLGYPNRDGTPVDQCDEDADCRVGFPAGRGWTGYCIEKKCWTRPGAPPEFCRFSDLDNNGNPKPWQIGDGNTVSVTENDDAAYSIDDLYLEVGSGTEITWRVWACLSRYKAFPPPGKDVNPCPQGPGLKDSGEFNGVTVP